MRGGAEVVAGVPVGVGEVCRRLRGAGHGAWLVGGCVRDLLLGRVPKDWDVVTAARPEEVEGLFEKTVGVGKAFGVIQVVVGGGGGGVEVATFRGDSRETRDGRHPASVRFGDIRGDALRRDFTINALYMDPETGEVRDETGGCKDLAAKRVRAVGEAGERFREDALRMLRAVRFAAVLEFGIEGGTMAAIREHAGLLGRVSRERVRDEVFRILTEGVDASRGLELLDGSGLLGEVLPEVAAMHGVEQPVEFHPEGDVFQHTLKMLGLMGHPRSLRLTLGVLLHDVGKPVTAVYKEGRGGGGKRWTFALHAAEGARLTEAILRRFKAPNTLREGVVGLVGGHMRLADAPKMREGKLRRLLADPLFDDLLELHRLDCLASHGQLGCYHFLRERRAALAAEGGVAPRLVRGRDLIALGLKPGPMFRFLLRKAEDMQLEGEGDKGVLLEAVLRLARGGGWGEGGGGG